MIKATAMSRLSLFDFKTETINFDSIIYNKLNWVIVKTVFYEIE